MPREYELTLTENGRLNNLLNLAQMQEETLNCITESYKNYIIGKIFKRLNINPKEFVNTIINFASGKLVIKDEEVAPKKPMEAQVKGVKK
jgi:hypothetical protein